MNETTETETGIADDLQLETDMPKSRALRRRARFYLEQTHGLLHDAYQPLEGKSGLTADEHLNLLRAGLDGVVAIRDSVARAEKDLNAAIVAREAEMGETTATTQAEATEEVEDLPF